MSTTPSPLAVATPVTIDNFIRAESDLYFRNMVKDGGFGKFVHRREPAVIDHQTVIRLNRDTLYSAAVFDLDAAPVTITLPDAGTRFRSLMVVNQDHYVPLVGVWRRQPDSHQGEDRHALRRRRRSHLRGSGKS